MGLFGALFAGVAGLGSQSNKIGIVSNNISNVNTVGYKQGNASFDTLVVPGGSSGTFSPGGVLGNNRQLVAQQGLISATTSNTDMAISGGGLFVVNTKPDGSGDTMYTRAGSFTPDSSGNFKNSAGFYLQGMPIADPQPEPNARLLTTVNVNPNATGASVATTGVTLAANFNASQKPLTGAGEVASLSKDTTNANNSLSQILIPTSGASGNNLVRGDSFTATVNTSGQTTSYKLTYGGFNISRNSTTLGGIGDGGFPLVTDSIPGGASIAGTPNVTTANIPGIVATDQTTSATASGSFSPGTLTFGSASIIINAGDSLNTIKANLQAALPAGSTVTVTPATVGPFTLSASDAAGANIPFSGTALQSNVPTFTQSPLTGTTTTDGSIDGIQVATNTSPVVGNGLFKEGTLSFGGLSVTVDKNDTLTTLRTKLLGVLPAGSTITFGGTPNNLSLQVSNSTAGSAGFAGSAIAASTTPATASANTNTATPAATVSSLYGINVADKTTVGLPFAVGAGLFSTGTLTIGNHTVALDATTDSLQGIANKITAALPAGSTAEVTGNPGNWNIIVTDTGHPGSGFGSTGALSGADGVGLHIGAATSIPALNQFSVTVPVGDAQKYVVGTTAYISGVTGTLGTATAAQINGQNLKIVAVDSSTGKVTLQLPSGVTNTGTGTALGGTTIQITNRTHDFIGNMLDASNDTDDFLGTTGTADFSPNSTNFVATVNGKSYSFTYNSTPNAALGQFNSLSTLVSAMNSSTDGNITASLVNHQLYISAKDPAQGITFDNGDAVGATSGTDHLSGIDWIQELDLKDIPKADTGTFRFDSMQSLADQVNLLDPTVIGATVNGRSASINAVDPHNSISFSDDATNTGSIVRELGFKPANGGNLTAVTGGFATGSLDGIYNASDPAKNMSSGAVPAQFSKDLTVYDSLGISHTITLNVAKLSNLTWAVELTSVPASDVVSANNGATDGLISSGTVTFNGDGTLNNITGLSGNDAEQSIQVNWTTVGGGATASTIAFNMGTPFKTDGLSQFDGSSNVSQAIQNGAPTGQLTGVSIDENGFVTASFSNGQTQKLYEIPLASVNNPNALSAVSGNAYKKTLDSGEVSLSYAGTNGVGTFASSALEQSNVDLSTQLTDLIVAQQAYGANTRVLTVTSQLLQQLNQIIQ